MTLLEKAKQESILSKYAQNKEELLDTALAYMKGQVTMSGIARATGILRGNLYAMILCILREAIKADKIMIIRVKALPLPEQK